MGLSLECNLDRFARQFACGGYGCGLDGRKNLPVGGVIGGLLELPSQQQSLLDQKSFKGRPRMKCAARPRRSSGEPETTADSAKLPESITAPRITEDLR